MSVSGHDVEHDEAWRRITGASTALLRRGFISADFRYSRIANEFSNHKHFLISRNKNIDFICMNH